MNYNLTFNEWQAYIRKELGYPTQIIELYEQNCRGKEGVSKDKRGANEAGRYARGSKDKHLERVENN